MSGEETPKVQHIGFTQLSKSNGASPQSGSYEANIIFVHGLRGHPQMTWEDSPIEKSEGRPATSSIRKSVKTIFRSRRSDHNHTNNGGRSTEHKVFWLRDYLVEDIPEASVWTYGYNADMIGGLFQANNQNSISQHGRDLAVKIEREIENQAIRRSDILRSRTKLIVFLGTPHQGSSYASWGVIVSNLAILAFQDSNKDIARSLEVNSEVLDIIQNEFLRIAHDISIKVHSFQEARAMSGVKGLHEKVVGDFSSKVGLPPSLETVESIDANHTQMARCSNKDDPQYRAISGVLKKFVRDSLRCGIQSGPWETNAVVTDTEAASSKANALQSNCAGKPRYYIPLPRNRRFTGRDALLDDLRERLFIQKECQRLAVVGLGGVGKTQVALELAYRVKDSQPECAVLWVPALSDGSFAQAYMEIARRLEIQVDEKDPKKSVRRHLESEGAGKWFLIVDNADDKDILFGLPGEPSGIDEYLPKSDNGITLFTTRSREVAVSVATNDVIDLEQMSPQEAKSFLGKTLIQKQLLQDEAITKALLQELTYLPLAISQAAAYLNRNQMSIKKYLALLRGTEQDMVSLLSREFHDGTRYSGSQNAVAATWLVSFDQISNSDGVAANLLSFISCIEPKAIPQSIFPDSQSEGVENAIGTLCGYAFLARREDEDMFDMHSLVHMAIRVWIQKHDTIKQTRTSAMQHLVSISPTRYPETRALWREYLPHALRALWGSADSQDKERFDLFFIVGCLLCYYRRYKEAIPALEKAYYWTKRRFSEEDHSRQKSERSLATAYIKNRQAKEAIKLLEPIVAIYKKTLTEEHDSRLSSEYDLAKAYFLDGQMTQAIEIYERIVVIYKKTRTDEDSFRVLVEYHLAHAYRNNGRMKEAIEMLELITIRRKTLAKENFWRLSSECKLARAYLADGRITKAIEIFKPVVLICKKTRTEDNHLRLSAEYHLAKAYLYGG
ncbi:hypothetical protein F4779DRAFT_642503 [Xylariaceae sp. FL0662B]|nr:hypothetical protein F4779DRAFT_642503 [Xylariaceae sp. FL0662B]